MAPSFGPTVDESGELQEPEEPYLKAVWEQIFNLNYHGDLSLTEAWNLPIGIRRWYFNRLREEIEEEKEQQEKAKSKAKRQSGTPNI